MRDYVSIIWVHHSANAERVALARICLNILMNSIDYPSELIVVDNGGDYGFSQFLLRETEQGRITHYLRNSDNVYHGEGRNYAIGMTKGKYIAVVDNDIELKKGWLSEGVKVLEATKRILYTPINIIRGHDKEKFNRDPITIDGKEYKLNKRAGSNCWMMKREDWKKIGVFSNHLIAGHKWTSRCCKKGYVVAVAPEQKASHPGAGKKTPYRGYNRKIPVEIRKKLLDGTEIKP